MHIEAPESTTNSLFSVFVMDGAVTHQTSERRKNETVLLSLSFGKLLALSHASLRAYRSHFFLRSVPKFCAQSHIVTDPFFHEFSRGVMYLLRFARYAPVPKILGNFCARITKSVFATSCICFELIHVCFVLRYHVLVCAVEPPTAFPLRGRWCTVGVHAGTHQCALRYPGRMASGTKRQLCTVLELRRRGTRFPPPPEWAQWSAQSLQNFLGADLVETLDATRILAVISIEFRIE